MYYSFPNLAPVHCSMSGSNCCFLTCIQISQGAGKGVWYSHLFKNFPQFVVIHTGKGLLVFRISSVQSCLTLWPHELQHARPPCPSLTPGVYSNSCPSSWWCHPAISSSVVPFSSCPIPPSIRVFSNENSSHEVAKVLEFQLQHQSFQWTPRTDLL